MQWRGIASSMSCNTIRKNVGQMSDVAIEVVLYDDPLAACFAQATAKVGILNQAADSARQFPII